LREYDIICGKYAYSKKDMGRMMKGNNTKIVKKANAHLVLQCIISSEPITLEEVIEKTDLSRPTVVNIVKELTDQGMVYKSGFAQSTGGRSPVLLSLNESFAYTIGIDFEFPPIRIAISNFKGKLILYTQIDVDSNLSKDDILLTMLNEVEALIKQSGIPLDKFIGVGVGIFGYLDMEKGVSIAIQRISDWKDVDFKQLIKERFNLPVYIQNDIHMMALAEKKRYLQESNKDFAYVGIRPGARSGIGLALFINGSIYGGNKGDAYLFGHMTIDIHGPVCICGSRGCLEAIAGERNVIAKYKSLREPSEGLREINGIRDIEAEALHGDVIARKVIDEVGSYLGVAIANAVKLFGITTIVIGGPDASLYAAISEEHVHRNVYTNIAKDVQLIVGKLEEQWYPLGSCFMVLDHFFKEPKLNLET
jgi:predicted NBD/HSP70 family sugar kinase